jgi:hypothetical protein
MVSAATRWQLYRADLARRRHLRGVLRDMRRSVLVRPAGPLTTTLTVAGYCFACLPVGLTAFRAAGGSPDRLLLLVAGGLVSGQLLMTQRFAAQSPRIRRNTGRVLTVLGSLVVLGVAAAPSGGWLRALWLAHPVLWRHGGLYLVLALVVALAVVRVASVLLGLRRLLSEAFSVAALGTVAARVVLGHGELAVLTVGVFHPSAELLPAATTLTAFQAARMALRASRRAGGHERLLDAVQVAGYPAELRRRELAGWVYDMFLSGGGRRADSLPQAILGLAGVLVPPVTARPGARPYLRRANTDLRLARTLLHLAEETIALLTEEAVPRLSGVERARLERRILLLRAGAASIRSRLLLADGDPAGCVAELRAIAALESEADLPNLAAHATLLEACVAVRYDLDPPGALPDLVHDPALDAAIRVPAMWLLAVVRVRAGDVEEGRRLWQAAGAIDLRRSNLDAVAEEVRTEAGMRFLLRRRLAVRNRLGIRLLAAVAADELRTPPPRPTGGEPA